MTEIGNIIFKVKYVDDWDPFVETRALLPTKDIFHEFIMDLPLKPQMKNLMIKLDLQHNYEDAAIQVAETGEFLNLHHSLRSQRDSIPHETSPLIIIKCQGSVKLAKIIDTANGLSTCQLRIFLIKLRHTIRVDQEFKDCLMSSDGLGAMLGARKLDASLHKLVLRMIKELIDSDKGIEYVSMNPYCVNLMLESFGQKDNVLVKEMVEIMNMLIARNERCTKLIIRTIITLNIPGGGMWAWIEDMFSCGQDLDALTDALSFLNCLMDNVTDGELFSVLIGEIDCSDLCNKVKKYLSSENTKLNEHCRNFLTSVLTEKGEDVSSLTDAKEATDELESVPVKHHDSGIEYKKTLVPCHDISGQNGAGASHEEMLTNAKKADQDHQVKDVIQSQHESEPLSETQKESTKKVMNKMSIHVARGRWKSIVSTPSLQKPAGSDPSDEGKVGDLELDCSLDGVALNLSIAQYYPVFGDLTEEDDTDTIYEQIPQPTVPIASGPTATPSDGPPPPPPMLGSLCPAPPSLLPPSPGQKEPQTQGRKTYLQLFWTQISSNPREVKFEKTIWAKLKTPSSFNAEEIRGNFEVKAPSAIKNSTATSSQIKELEVLDKNRSRSVCIVMSKLPGIEIIKQALLNFDMNFITRDIIEKIGTIMPTEEEIQSIQKAIGQSPNVPLAAAENLMINITCVPDCAVRVRLWIFILNYDANIAGLIEMLEDTKVLIQQIEESQLITHILSSILAIGNAINKKPNTKGFKIFYLEKALSVKDLVYKRPLMFYVCKMVMESKLSDVDVYDELRMLSRCSKYDYDFLASTIVELKGSIQSAVKDYRTILVHSSHNSVTKRLNRKLLDILSEYSVLKGVHKRIINRFCKLVQYFGYGEKESLEMKMDTFFQCLNSMALEYRTQWNLIKNDLEAQKKAQERKDNLNVKSLSTAGERSPILRRSGSKTSFNKECRMMEDAKEIILGSSALGSPNSRNTNHIEDFMNLNDEPTKEKDNKKRRKQRPNHSKSEKSLQLTRTLRRRDEEVFKVLLDDSQ